MKNKSILLGSLLLSGFFSKSQSTDTNTTIKVDKTEVEYLYNQYTQTGDNSAVTGGKGTERLIVYGPAISWKKGFGKHSVNFKLGSDVISSASTDNINFVQSSASRLDAKTYLNVGYDRQLKHGLSLSTGMAFSIESDYFSIGNLLGISKVSKNRMQTYDLSLELFNDDLRWGRLHKRHKGPAFLIYPKELRYKEWYHIVKRQTFNSKFGFTQVINKYNVAGITGVFTYQNGLLETPFHRVYFTDGSVSVEQLPEKRYKWALALKLNSFVNGQLIFKNAISGYTDNFGVHAITLDHETAYKVNPKWTLYGTARFYNQASSYYFAPYRSHNINNSYYTSDYDLSGFSSIKLGIGVKISPNKMNKKQRRFDAATLRYNFYKRSNSLAAHLFSLSVKTSTFNRRRK